tara:strand:- start:406 stop:681 length:276 start_codon:yes stop_codon:yes gene_type:complete
MKTKKPTANKDGSLRKKGSGRKKGSNSFVKIPFSSLKDYISEKTPIVVSRVWLEGLGLTQDETSEPITLPLTKEESSVKIPFTLTTFEEEE